MWISQFISYKKNHLFCVDTLKQTCPGSYTYIKLNCLHYVFVVKSSGVAWKIFKTEQFQITLTAFYFNSLPLTCSFQLETRFLLALLVNDFLLLFQLVEQSWIDNRFFFPFCAVILSNQMTEICLVHVSLLPMRSCLLSVGRSCVRRVCRHFWGSHACADYWPLYFRKQRDRK